jgi:hypothetical protein
MKKLFYLLMISFLFSCSADSLETNQCDCVRSYYEWRIIGYANGGLTPIRQYVLQNSNPSVKMDCSEDTNDGYILVEGNIYEKIVCAGN